VRIYGCDYRNTEPNQAIQVVTPKAVEDLSLTVEDGAIFGFVGPNGAGKTSTIRIMPLLKPHGDIFVSGYSVTKEPGLCAV
jgi:ABC-type multidrug transport system ATPase subunit